MLAVPPAEQSASLCFFGSPRLLDGRGRRVALPAKAYLLLLYLTLSREPLEASRSSLKLLLWPDAERRKASNNLRQLVARVRAVQDRVGIALISADATHVRLASAGLRIDVVEFTDFLSGDCASAAPAELLEVYGGDLFAGFSSEGNDAQDWLAEVRQRFRGQFVVAAVKILRGDQVDAGSTEFRALADELVLIDPYQEDGVRALMRHHAACGEAGLVRDVYERFTAHLRRELDAAPDPATTGLFRQLARGDQGRSQTSTNWQFPEPVRRSGLPKITVLPPPELDGANRLHRLAASLIEDVTVGLHRHKALTVVVSYPAWKLSRIESLEEAVSRFAIDYVAETQLSDHDGTPFLSIKLFSTEDRRVIWADRCAMGHADVAQRFGELSLKFITTFVEQVERAELSRDEPQLDRAAYFEYLSGQRRLEAIDLPSVRKAQRSLRSVVKGYPDFAPGLCGLARSYQREWLLTARHDTALLTRAEEIARRAIEADPDDSRGYRELGVCLLFERRFDDSLEALALAEERNPHHADLLVDLADSLGHSGAPKEGLSKLDEALTLNPLPTDLFWWTAAGMHYQTGNYHGAIEAASRMRNQWPVSRLLAAAWAQLGEKERAREYVDGVLEVYPDFEIKKWLTIVPQKSARDAKHYEEGLRAAGFE
jgi:DNA-binding SARP family transcriptional activator/TolB-like protein